MTEQFINVIKAAADALNKLNAMDVKDEKSCNQKVQDHIEKAAEFVKSNCMSCPNKKKDVGFCDYFINEVVVTQLLGEKVFEGGKIGCLANKVSEAMKETEKWGSLWYDNKEVLDILTKAESIGWVKRLSHTQIQYTENAEMEMFHLVKN